MAEELIVIAKRDCPTCTMLEDVYARLAAGPVPVRIYSQDDPTFPKSVNEVIDDTTLEVSFQHQVEIVPTLI